MSPIKFLACLSALVFLTFSCKKDDAIKTEIETADPLKRITAAKDPEVAFSFRALVNSKPLVPGTAWYTNVSNDNFTVTKFTYYISNIKLKRADGTFFSEPESYHLIKHVEGETTFTIAGVPQGVYDGIEFLIGVDSIRNFSGAQTGALDPANQMFWEWNTGYIFFKLEGSFNTVSQPQTGDYAIHIGGGTAQLNCLQKCTFSLDTPIRAQGDKRSAIFYDVLVDEIFEKPVLMDFTTYYSSISEETFKAVSDNYRDMFVVVKVEN